MGFDDICNVGIGLGIGCLVKQEKFSQSDFHQQKKKKLFLLKHDQFFPSDLTLGPSAVDTIYQSANTKVDASKLNGDHQLSIHDLHPQASSLSAVSSLISNSSSVKKEKDFGGDQEVELERVSSRVSTDEDEEGSPRKKLRLDKEQSAVLEEKFKEHSTLNPKQKLALAEQLNLRPRQVEVWFQNRRARTKLKQTEVDCEFLKKCCETLTEENQRLQKELQELKSLSYCMQLPAATLTMCPSCERVANSNGGESPAKTPFTIGQKSQYFFNNPFTHPSAAC